MASIIALLFYTDMGKDLKERFYPNSVTTTTVIPTRTTVPAPSDTTTSISKTMDTEPEECHDSLIIDEAERFFSSVRNAPIATYDAGKLPPGFDKTPEIEYEGELKAGSDSKITGEMKFFHKKSGNIFTLKSDGAVSPKNGDEWTEPETSMEFVWIRGGCYDMGCDETHCEDWEKPVYQVCVEGFWMGKQEVTQGQWKKVTGNNSTVKGTVEKVERTYITVDIGKEEKVREGMRLLVYELDPRDETLGQAEIESVEEKKSDADLLDKKPDKEIKKGDHVITR